DGFDTRAKGLPDGCCKLLKPELHCLFHAQYSISVICVRRRRAALLFARNAVFRMPWACKMRASRAASVTFSAAGQRFV
ncbi:hypothetical protein, partial [Anaerotruncus colihominis]|uniref:hypothetical protein n=1 Tax=Anaerotruncus colihominis TaxID=169435 RepID=UPI00210C7A89